MVRLMRPGCNPWALPADKCTEIPCRVALFLSAGFGVRFARRRERNRGDNRPLAASPTSAPHLAGALGQKRASMKGLIAAAGVTARLQSRADKRLQVLFDHGGEALPGNPLHH